MSFCYACAFILATKWWIIQCRNPIERQQETHGMWDKIRPGGEKGNCVGVWVWVWKCLCVVLDFKTDKWRKRRKQTSLNQLKIIKNDIFVACLSCQLSAALMSPDCQRDSCVPGVLNDINMMCVMNFSACALVSQHPRGLSIFIHWKSVIKSNFSDIPLHPNPVMPEPVFSLTSIFHELPTASQIQRALPTNRHSSSRCCQQSNEKSQNGDWKCRLRSSHSQHMLQLLSAYLRKSQFILPEGIDYLWHLATERQAFHPAVPGVITRRRVGGGRWGVWVQLPRSFDGPSIPTLNDDLCGITGRGQFFPLFTAFTKAFTFLSQNSLEHDVTIVVFFLFFFVFILICHLDWRT